MDPLVDHALSDLRILDLTRVVAGPYCTRMLAEMGAEVIKIEPAPAGEISRRASVFRKNRSLYFVQQNQGKQSVCVNLKDPRGIALVAELVPHVDAVVENFRPGVLDAIGLGYERLRELKEDIILCSISSFGQEGPLATKPGYDFIAQAYSGMTSMIGKPGEPPSLPSAAIGDASTGAHAALAIVSAIHRRNRTGKGERIDVSILDVYYAYHDANVHVYSGTEGGVLPIRQGRYYGFACPCGVFHCGDEYIVVMGMLQHWPDLCRAIGREELIEHPDFRDDRVRGKRRDELTKILEDWLAGFSSVSDAVKELERFDVPCAPVLSVAEATHHPHLRQRGTVQTIDDPLHGPVDIPAIPIKWDTLPNDARHDAPTLGQHNRTVLAKLLGRSEEDLKALHQAGVLIEREI